MGKVWIFFFVVLLVGCKGEPSPQNNNIIVINVEELPDDDILTTNGVPDSCEFIKLETNENCLIEMMDEVVITDSLVILHGPFEMVMHIFNRQGKYINSIKGGRGPGEPGTLRVWYVDTVYERILNLDLHSGRWYHYTYTGELLETIPMSDSLYRELKPQCIADIRPIDNEYFLAVYSDHPDIEFKYYVLSRKDMSVVDAFVKQRHWKYMDFQNSSASIAGTDRLFTFSYLYDTVYIVNPENQIVPKYAVNGVRKPLNQKVYDKVIRGIDIESEPFPFFERNYSIGIVGLYATKQHIFMYMHGLDQDVHAIMGDLSTNRFSKSLLNFREDALSYYSPYFIGATDNGFIGYVSPMELLKDKDAPFVQGHPQLREICKTLKEDDNPIIGIYYVKK